MATMEQEIYSKIEQNKQDTDGTIADTNTQVAQNEADINFIAMMSDIEL